MKAEELRQLIDWVNFQWSGTGLLEMPSLPAYRLLHVEGFCLEITQARLQGRGPGEGTLPPCSSQRTDLAPPPSPLPALKGAPVAVPRSFHTPNSLLWLCETSLSAKTIFVALVAVCVQLASAVLWFCSYFGLFFFLTSSVTCFILCFQ